MKPTPDRFCLLTPQDSSSRGEASMLGGYRLLEPIGQGAHARVFRALDPQGRMVALKMPWADRQIDPASDRRIDREIRAFSALRHPNLLSLIDSGIDEKFGRYLVTPLIDGRTLRQFSAEMRLCPESALVLLIPLLEGLSAIHGAGFVHRDLKPENIMVTAAGDLVIVDFGLVRNDAQSRLTVEGTVAGSVPYMSPEQIQGQPVTPRSDVWSVGLMAYEWIAGRRPFARSLQTEEVAAILHCSFQPLALADRRVSPELSDLIGSCLSGNPLDRPANAQAFLARVRSLIDWATPGALPAEFRRLLADPVGFEAQTAERQDERLKAQAEAAIAAGDSLCALHFLDRALAYHPDDPGIPPIVDRAASLGGKANTVADRIHLPDHPPSRQLRRRKVGVAALAAGLAVTSLALMAWSLNRSIVPEDDPKVVFGESAPVLPEVPRPVWQEVDRVVLPGLKPIPMADLGNTAPRTPFEQVAKPGEPLVSPEIMGPGGPKAALADIERQLAAAPDDVELRVSRALVLLANRRTEEGLSELAAVSQKHPDLPGVWSAIGYVALRQGQLSEAEQHLSKAIQLDPGKVDALRNRAILRSRFGRRLDAYRDLAQALRYDPDDIEALKELSGLYEQTGHRSDAVPLLEHLTRLRPRDPLNWVNLSVAQPDPALSRSAALRAISLEQDLPAANRRLCTVLTNQHDPQAIAVCTRALKLEPGEPQPWMNRGLAHFFAGNDQRALADMDEAIKLEPQDGSYVANRSIVRTHAGQTAAAAADIQIACQLGHVAACNQVASKD